MDDKRRAQVREQVKAVSPWKAEPSAASPLPRSHDPGAYSVALLHNYTHLHTGI